MGRRRSTVVWLHDSKQKIDISLSRGALHFPAFGCALAAGLGAFPAVLHTVLGMLLTFGGAGVAYIGTKPAQLSGKIPIYAHHFGGSITEGRAFHIGLNTAGQHINVFLPQTGRSAMVTGSSTLQACVYARLELNIVCHSICFKIAAIA